MGRGGRIHEDQGPWKLIRDDYQPFNPFCINFRSRFEFTKQNPCLYVFCLLAVATNNNNKQLPRKKREEQKKITNTQIRFAILARVKRLGGGRTKKRNFDCNIFCGVGVYCLLYKCLRFRIATFVLSKWSPLCNVVIMAVIGIRQSRQGLFNLRFFGLYNTYIVVSCHFY